MRAWSRVPVYSPPITLNPLASQAYQDATLFPYEIKAPESGPYLALHYDPDAAYGVYSLAYVGHRFGSSREAQTDVSWRSLYLTAPPITDIVVRLQTNLASDLRYYQIDVHAEMGVTLGLVCDKVERKLDQISIIDSRSGAGKRKCNPPTEGDFFGRWGRNAHPLFIVARPRDATRARSQ